MKINEECIRDVLSYLANNLTIQIINNKKGDFNSVSLLSLMITFDEKYSKEDVWYSIYNLSQDRYIETDDIRSLVMQVETMIKNQFDLDIPVFIISKEEMGNIVKI